MADIKFGRAQLSNPTPSKVNLIARVFTVVAGIFLGWMSTNNLIGPVTQGYIGSIVGLALALVNGLAPLFGVDVNSPIVPTSKVKSLDTDKTE